MGEQSQPYYWDISMVVFRNHGLAANNHSSLPQTIPYQDETSNDRGLLITLCQYIPAPCYMYDIIHCVSFYHIPIVVSGVGGHTLLTSLPDSP